MTEPVYGEYLLRPKTVGQVAVVRQEIAQGQPEQVGLQIREGALPIEPNEIEARVYKRDENTVEETDSPLGILALTYPVGSMVREDTGIYSIVIPSVVTQHRGQLNVVWTYTIGVNHFSHQDYYEITEEMPTFGSLSLGERSVVDRTMIRFADSYDSFDGGPHLKEEFQTHFSRERVAQLLTIATANLNFMGQPMTNYVVGSTPGKRFPAKYYGILEWGLYLEVIRHLIRSYTEQPVLAGSNGVAYDDRRDYTNRWREVLRDEETRFGMAVTQYKRSMLDLGGGNLLVSGGIFGRNSWGAGAASGMYTAALRGYHRAYPVSYVVSTGF